MLIQFKSGDTISQQSACSCLLVKNLDIDPFSEQKSRRREPCRPGTDNGHFFSYFVLRKFRFQTFFEPLFTDMCLYGTNRDRTITVIECTSTFAESVMRTDTAHHLRERRRFIGERKGKFKIVTGCRLKPLGDEVVQRTTVMTVRITALNTSGRLLSCFFRLENLIDLIKIPGSLHDRSFFGINSL